MTHSDVLMSIVRAAIFVVTALSLIDYLRRPSKPRRDVLWMFLSLAIPTFTGMIAELLNTQAHWLTAPGTVAIMCHPYLLLRLVGHLRPLPRVASVVAIAVTGLSVALSLVFPQPPPQWVSAVLIGGFLLIESYATWLFAFGAWRSSGVRRWRLGAAAAGSAALLAIIALAALNMALGGPKDAFHTQVVLLSVAMVSLYYIGFQPPVRLLGMWQSLELQRLLEMSVRDGQVQRARTMIDNLSSAVADGLGAEGAAVVQRDGGRLLCRSAVGWERDEDLSISMESALGRALSDVTAGIHLVTDQAQLSEAERALITRVGGGALLVSPVVVAGRVWGALVAITSSSSLFPDAEKDFLRLFGQQLALVLEVDERLAQQQALVDRMQAMNAQLESASRHKSRFLASMSHELRTPLNAIIGYSEMLQEELIEIDGEPYIQDLQRIGAAGRHLLGLINNILDISKIEAGKVDVTITPCDVSALIDEAVAAVGPAIEGNGNRLKLELGAGLETFHTDPVMLRQILVNLLGNAAKFSKDGTITLRAERVTEATDEPVVVADGARLRLAVSDTGIGMTADEQRQVFTAFTQANSDTSRLYGGTGLGLSLCQSFTQLLGGEIGVDSQLGEGSTFTVVITDQRDACAASANATPQLTAASTQPSADANQAVAAETCVVVIEDDPDAADLIRRHVEAMGYRVHLSETGERGLELAREFAPIAVLLDIVLPGIDGWSVLDQLKADSQTKDIPVILVTLVSDSRRGFSLGAADYLQKPVQADRLRSVIERLVQAEQRPTALVIDDDADARVMMRRQLEARGVEVRTAVNGREGMQLLTATRPDVVLLDLMMPVLDGFGFLQEQQANPAVCDVPVIVLTAKQVDSDDRLHLPQNILGVLLKSNQPVSDVAEEVCAALRDVTGAVDHGLETAPA